MTERLGNVLGGLLALSGALCLAGAVIARMTGDEIHLANGFAFRTQQDASSSCWWWGSSCWSTRPSSPS